MTMQVIWGVLVPAVVAAVGMWVVWGPWILRRHARIRDGAMAVCVAAAMFIALCSEIGWPALPPAQKWHGMAWVAVCLMVMAVAAAAIGRRAFPTWEAGALATGVILSWCIAFPGSDRSAQLVVIFGIAFGVPAMIRLSRRIEGAGVPMSLWLTFAVLSVLGMETTFPTLAIMLGGVSAAWCAAAVVGRLTKTTSFGPASAIVAVSIIAVTSMVGWTYSYDFHPVVGWHWIVVAMSPLMLVVTANAAVDRWPPSGQLIARLVVVAIPLAIVLASVMQAAAEAADDSGNWG